MQDFRAMAIFAEVVQHQSMQKTAEKLGLTVSTVSQAISKLEKQCGIKLLNRTTRRIALTNAGEQFYQGCLAMLAGAEQAMKVAEELQDEPSGTVSIATYSTSILTQLKQALYKVQNTYPKLAVTLQLTDTLADLYQQKTDIALRAGIDSLDNPQLIAKKLMDLDIGFFATPELLAKYPTPQTPAEMQNLQWIVPDRAWLPPTDEQHNPTQWRVTHAQTGEEKWFKTNPKIISADSLASYQLMLAHLGVTILAKQEVQADLDAGRLVQLLPEWKLPPVPYYLVMLNRQLPKKVRAVAEMVEGGFYINPNRFQTKSGGKFWKIYHRLHIKLPPVCRCL
ncbi:LysR family transcriptional regulator [Actinobacillus arthritidis]|uniref:LysR family transcriptional regulator n=1 Tax=Actinobacillus arthritidis TaxID=157339 RepID=UPI0024426835|nr:LysR family transcriptional regulator [Actinobacillus arthritidis]WGE89432.1 LysR family transcriptional regulator [Actinobacillus arthritidis]